MAKKLNRKMQIAIDILTFLKGRTDVVTAANISKEIGAPEAFLEQILRKLRIGFLVIVRKGPSGGYLLHEGKSVTLFDVAKALNEEPFEFAEPKDLYEQINNDLVKFYKETKIV